MGRKILGIAGSLRNIVDARLGRFLLRDLQSICDEAQLREYLTLLTTLSGPRDAEAPRNLPPALWELHRILSRRATRRGLSNSEVALAAALWKAAQEGAEIDFCSLRDYFLPSQESRNISSLKERLLTADALLFSGPVYFGDRGSLIHELVWLIRRDRELRQKLDGRLYGGISVGAKRNGGQETTLIYQILDMVSLGFFAVGNDSETTSQYGGTCHAGDLGSIPADTYGLATSKGVGRRLANLLRMLEPAPQLIGKTRILFVILQDLDGLAARHVASLIERFESRIEATMIDATRLNLTRCLACDVCPKEIDDDEIYRCRIIGDDFAAIHPQLLDHDGLVPVVFSSNKHANLATNYQVFMERTRYLRRGDYALSDVMVSPLVYRETGTREYSEIRMITSLIRHQTVIAKPIVADMTDGAVVNSDDVDNDFERFLSAAGRLGAARLSNAVLGGTMSTYKPVGYVVSAAKDNEKSQLELRQAATRKRLLRWARQARGRLAPQ